MPRVPCHESTFVRLTTTGSLLLLVACLVLGQSVLRERICTRVLLLLMRFCLTREAVLALASSTFTTFHDLSACVSEECTRVDGCPQLQVARRMHGCCWW